MTVYAQNGSLTRSFENHDDGSFTISSEQDLEGIIEQNKMLRENQTGKEKFRLAARVPVHIVEKAMREGWLHDEDKWKRWLNDGENRDFRVWEGQI